MGLGHPAVDRGVDRPRRSEIGGRPCLVAERRKGDAAAEEGGIDPGLELEGGIVIGDGMLPHPGLEHIFETYYRYELSSLWDVTLDYQFINNPAYNRDRGPVSVVAVRLHADF